MGSYSLTNVLLIIRFSSWWYDRIRISKLSKGRRGNASTVPLFSQYKFICNMLIYWFQTHEESEAVWFGFDFAMSLEAMGELRNSTSELTHTLLIIGWSTTLPNVPSSYVAWKVRIRYKVPNFEKCHSYFAINVELLSQSVIFLTKTFIWADRNSALVLLFGHPWSVFFRGYREDKFLGDQVNISSAKSLTG